MGCCYSTNAEYTSLFEQQYERVHHGEILGKGACGAVCEYRNKSNGVHYAVKTSLLEEITNESPVKLRKERAICACLDHANIARFVESFIEASCTYLVFELVDGKDLFAEICAKPCYSERDASSYMRQLLSAVAYCHDNDIVHADIKPDNILLRPSDDTIKLIDFGMAFKAQNDERGRHRVRGTLLYIAPEMASNKPFGKPVDLWSCGVILYNILSGVHPFTVLEGTKKSKQLKQLRTKQFNFPSPHFDGISQHARNLVRVLLRRDQDRRESARLALKYPFVNDIGLSSTDHRQLTIDGLKVFFTTARFQSLDPESSGELINPDECVTQK